MIESYGADWTGRLLSNAEFEKGYDTIYRVNLDIMNNSERAFDSDGLKLHFNEYTRWHEVKMPLRRQDVVSEVLVFMCFT